MPIRPENRDRSHSRLPVPLPGRDRLLQLLRYEPLTGTIYWHDGRSAFTTMTADGYMQGRVDGVLLYAHRVIWKMLHDEEPPQIDHRDGNRSNNREGNLRAATRAINMANQSRRRDNVSGACGVGRKGSRWRAYIRGQHLGYFDTREAAIAARAAANREHGFSERHGEPRAR